MAIAILSQASRYNTGSDLWVIPPLSVSQQTLQIDWYLNFQIAQSEGRHKSVRSTELKNILQQVDWSLDEDIHFNKNNLMISPGQNLPCRWILIISNSEDLKAWTKDLFESWSKLGQPSLRVFLPPQISANEWATQWNTFSSFDDMTVVLDS